MELLTTILLTAIVAVLIVYVLINIRIRMNPMYNKIPTMPYSNVFFGNIWDFLRDDCQLLKNVKQSHVTHGHIRLSHFCIGMTVINIGEAKWLKYAMNGKTFQRGKFIGADDIFAGVGENGLIVVNGEKHKRLRKLASPAFKLTAIKKVMPIIEMCGNRMVKLFETECKSACVNGFNGKAEINVRQVIIKCTLDAISLITFGHDFQDSLSMHSETFGSEMRDLMDVQLSIFCIIPFQLKLKLLIMKLTSYIPDWLYEKVKFMRTIRRAHTSNMIHGMVDRIIEEKLADRRRSDWCQAKSAKTLLDFMLDGVANLVEINNQELHDLLMTFLIAGHETTTLGVTWSMYLLAKNPEHQRKCRQEARAFFREHPENVEWDQVKKLRLIDAVVHETLRLYPPVPWLNRVSVADDFIDGHYVPAGTNTMLIMAEAQRDGKYWTNPDEFLPERFLEPDANIPWDAFLPFSDGVHKCIGYQMGTVEIVYFLAIILNKFEFSIDPNVEYREYAMITMSPKPHLKLFMKPLE